jgi:ABC-2 type transport system ATP-binding protein
MNVQTDTVVLDMREQTAIAHAPAEASAGNGAAPRLSVRGASHAFGSHRALRGVDLEVAAGEVYGLLGPNGAGKTTLMRAISGRLKLSLGFVSINGRNPFRSRRARRTIGFVPQEIALYAQLTVRENLEVFGRFAGVRGSMLKKAVAALLDQANLSDRSNQLCGTLSGGYQRRVNICASLLHGPEVLVLDEPTVGIDVDAREAIHRLIEGVRDRGAAILLTTHDIEQAQMLCDRVGIMINGRIRVEGLPDALVRQTFGSAKEVSVILARALDTKEEAALRQMGLIATGAPLTWSRYAKQGDANANTIMARISAVGIPAKEVRVREPDLTSLFVAVVERSQQP